MIVTRDQLINAFSARIDELSGAVARVARQQLGVVLTDTHATDIALFCATRGTLRFGVWFGAEVPDDWSIVSALRDAREHHPTIFDTPSAEQFHDALKARHIPNADQIAGRLDDNERRREWLKLPPLRRGHC